MGLWQVALGIVAEILFVRHEQKDCIGKPDPDARHEQLGNAQKMIARNNFIC